MCVWILCVGRACSLILLNYQGLQLNRSACAAKWVHFQFCMLGYCVLRRGPGLTAMLPLVRMTTLPSLPCAAERTATSSRLASTLLDCMTQGSSKTAQQQTSPSTQVPAAETAASHDGVPYPVIIIACVESAEDVPASFRRCFTHELQLEAPDAAARLCLLQVCCPLPCMHFLPSAHAVVDCI